MMETTEFVVMLYWDYVLIAPVYSSVYYFPLCAAIADHFNIYTEVHFC